MGIVNANVKLDKAGQIVVLLTPDAEMFDILKTVVPVVPESTRSGYEKTVEDAVKKYFGGESSEISFNLNSVSHIEGAMKEVNRFLDDCLGRYELYNGMNIKFTT